MLIFLYGLDAYRLKQKQREIENQYRQKNGKVLNLEKMDVEAMNFQDFWDGFSQKSIFVKRQLFFLENVFQNDDFKIKFLAKAKEIAESGDVVVLVESAIINKKDKLFLMLQKLAKCQEFEILSGVKLKTWAKKEFIKLGCQIEEKALDLLLDLTKDDLWAMNNEIQKMSAFQKKIGEKEMLLFFKPKLGRDIFKTIEAIALANKKTALRLVENHLREGDSPFYLLTMIIYQFRNLILAKSCNEALCEQKIGLKPFPLQKARQLARSFSPDQLREIYQRLSRLDLQLKTGQIKPEEGLRMLVASI